METPARFIYAGDGSNRKFYIPTQIKGDDYVRIEIDTVYQSDRSLWDIVNNSIIFTVAPAEGAVIDIQVATSEESLGQLGSISNVDIVAGSIDNVNTVGNNLDKLDIVADNITNVNIVATSISNVNTTADYINNVNTVGTNISNVNTVANIDDNVTIVANDINNVNTTSTNIDSVNLVANAIEGGAGIGGGQFVGTGLIKGIQFMSQTSEVEDMIVVSGTNAFSVSSYTLANGASLTIEDGADYKVL